MGREAGVLMAPGEVLEVGRHRVVCGDLESTDVAQLMANTSKAAVIYSDPPWGAGNLRYWRTMNQQELEGNGPERWQRFLAAFGRTVAAHLAQDGVLFAEMGMRWENDLIGAMAGHGLLHRGIWKVQYGSPKRPNLLLAFTWPDCSKPEFCDVNGKDGLDVVMSAVFPVRRPGGILLDPCCGLGNSAAVAMETGMVFRGMELNPARLARTVELLQKGTGADGPR